MKVISFFVLIVSFVVALSADAKDSKTQKQSAASVLAKILELDSAANYLTAVADGNIVAPASCSLSSENAMKLLNPLHAKIDGDKDKWVALIKNQKKQSDSQWEHSCQARCHCAVYASLLEAVGIDHLSAPDQEAYRKISQLAEKQTGEAVGACAKKVKSFCSSSLLKSLNKDLQQSN